MGERERELGLDRLPLARAGRLGDIYHSGISHLSPRSAEDRRELPELVEQLGIAASMGAPLLMGSQVVGVVLATSARADFFDEHDLRFLEAVAGWIGLVGHRAVLVEELTERAAAEGVRVGAEDAIGQLSPRKREVARLVARGLTNAEIARELVLSEGTVANHVQEIRQRLGLRSRTELAVWMAERSRRSA
jgi:DNA-binding CsgD family transcriptional regulator